MASGAGRKGYLPCGEGAFPDHVRPVLALGIVRRLVPTSVGAGWGPALTRTCPLPLTYAFLQSLYRNQEVHRVVLVVHICDLLKDDLEKDEEALDDFDETVRILREAGKWFFLFIRRSN